MTLKDIIICPVCKHDELSVFKNYKKCKKCSAKIGMDRKGSTWYEYSIPVEERIEIDESNSN